MEKFWGANNCTSIQEENRDNRAGGRSDTFSIRRFLENPAQIPGSLRQRFHVTYFSAI